MDYSEIQIESSLPKPWEEEHTFNDVLYDWMNRAPWLAISAAAHVLAYFVLSSVPWLDFSDKKGAEIQAEIQTPPEEIFEEPEEEPEEEIIEEEIEEPVLRDSEITETETVEDFDVAEGEPDFTSDAPFESESFNNVLGIGGGAGGKMGGRGAGRGRKSGGSGTEQALQDALQWLKDHQSPDGYWDCDNFMNNNMVGGTDCDGPGNATHDVGVTGLALLAFLGDGHTTNEGKYKEVVKRGIAWLRSQQDPDSGLIGEDTSHDFIYDHAIATLAICESYYFGKSPLIKGTAQKAINYIQRARNPYGAWRYDVPPTGDNDTSVTGWMLFALTSAKEAGLKVDTEAIDGGLLWIDEVTDVQSGRIGYDAPNTMSSRTPANEIYPREKGEAMTAVGMLCRIFLGQDRDTVVGGEKILDKHADLLKTKLPVWDEEGYGCDMYYWYYGSYAMFQVGGDGWRKWEEAMKEAVLKNQRDDGDSKGSWDPVGPWGYSGGRVYSTALMTLCIEVYFRYGKVLGAR